MGRKLEFDRNKALVRATDLFWKQGYQGSSMAQLLRAMKLGEGSFYNSFGSKKALFLEAMGHYNAVAMAPRIAALKSEVPARQRIEDFFDVVAQEMASNKNPGCLFSNSLSHDLLSQKDFKLFAGKSIDGFLAFLSALIEEGQSAGDIASRAPSDRLAKLLFTHLHGIHRLSVHGYDAEQQRQESELFLSALLDR